MLLPSKRQELPEYLKVKLLWQVSKQAAPLTPHDKLHPYSHPRTVATALFTAHTKADRPLYAL